MRFPTLKTPYVLAPMSGVTDVAFRVLCKRHGAAMTTTEFCSADGIIRDSTGTRRQRITSEEEVPVAIQLFGKDIETVKEAATIVEPHADVIDLNLGCPAWHVLNQGCGSALLHEPKHIEAIVREVTDALKKPFTVKLRLGIDEHHRTYLDVAQRCVDAGAVAITLHARTAAQGYSGVADWDAIRRLKETVDVPVIGNGDVRKPQDAVRMREQTGCDAVMIGRAARNNPLIFRWADQLERHGWYDPLDPEDKHALFKEYLDLARKYNIPFLRIKSHAVNLTKGIPGAATFRERLVRAQTEEELRVLLEEAAHAAGHP